MNAAAETLLAAVGLGCVIGVVSRAVGDVASWVAERRTDRLAR